ASGDDGGASPARLARELASGALVGAVATGGRIEAVDGRLSGTTGPVLGAGLADVVVLPATVDGGEGGFAVEGRHLRARHVAALDPTQRLAEVTLDAAAAVRLAGIDRGVVERLGAALAAAVAVGGASWCVDTAAAHAAERHQFGRPIGQFQAVK